MKNAYFYIVTGAYGIDFSNCEDDVQISVQNVAQKLVRHGVTSFCPTLVTSSPEIYSRILSQMSRGPISGGASNLGVHVEGPFISIDKKGAHREEFIQAKPLERIEQIEATLPDMRNISIITVAPELDKGDVIKVLSDKGLTVSLGHSSSNLAQSEKAFQNGAKMITHLFNAMPVFHHRDPGLLGLLTLESERQIYFGIIADGIHTHYSALRLAYQANKSGMVLVSDAISAAGLSSGVHKIGPQKVDIRDNGAFIAGTDILCGAIRMLDDCVKFMRKHVPCPLVDVINCVTVHPAEVIGIQKKKGTLNFDSDADFIILNDNLDVLATFVNGELVFNSDKNPIDFNVLIH